MTPDAPKVTAVLDTNLFVSALLSELGAPYAIVEDLRARRFLLLVADAQRQELQRVLSSPKFTTRYRIPLHRLAMIQVILDTDGIPVEPKTDLPVEVRDPKDEVILGAAIAGNADFLVSGDHDLLVLAGDSRLGTLRIVTPRAFLEAIRPT